MKENIVKILIEMYLRIFPSGNAGKDRIERILEAMLLIPMYVLTNGDIERLRDILHEMK